MKDAPHQPGATMLKRARPLRSILVAVAKCATQQQEGTNGSSDDRNRRARVTVHLTAQTTIVIIGFVGEIFCRIGQAAAVIVAVFAETFGRSLGYPAAAPEQTLCTAGGVVGIAARAVSGIVSIAAHSAAHALASVANLTFDISVTHDYSPPSVEWQNAVSMVSGA
jgi:hypothetical protein